MATNTLNVRMRQAVRTEAEWTSDNPVLLEGEVAYSSDKNNMYKVGDGTKTWSQLSYGVHTRNDLVPVETHTYTDIIATENTEAKANFYWATVMPDDYNLPCMVRYRITATVPNATRAKTISDCTSLIVQSALPAYSDFNIVLNTFYRAIYSNIVYRATSTGITNKYGHALGTRLYSAWSPTNTSYKRTLKIELLETYNCSVTFFNTPVLYENLPGTGTTNYSALTYEDAANNGLQETADNNTVNEYAGGIVAGTNGLKAYALCMKVNDNQWESVVLSSTTDATKTKNSNGFLIDSPILYCNTSYNSGATSSASATYFVVWAVDLRYSINNASSSWTANGRPFFLVGTITDNKFYLKDTTWWTDTIPATADNYYYWYVGQTISGYQGTLYPNHPFYKFINGVFTQVDPLIYADHVHSIDYTVDEKVTLQYDTSADCLNFIFS